MVAVHSQMLPLGTPAPDFTLPDVHGNPIGLRDACEAGAVLVMFICNHCPYVKLVADHLAQLGHDYADKPLCIFAINSNDAERYPSDNAEAMAKEAEARGYGFPYLADATQEVAKAYRAACTPDFFLFDQSQKLVYRGQLDDARPGNGVDVTGKDLRAAIDAVLAGRVVSADQTPSIGCNIKWKPGSEPEYFG